MKIVILDHNTLTIGDMDFSPIEKLGEVTYHDALAPEELVPACREADAILINKAEITAEIMEQLPNLKYIGIFATGFNNVDLAAARSKGIDVCNVPGYSTDSVAQLVFAFIFSFATSIADYDAAVHRGEWIFSPTFAFFPYYLSELAGKTLGIVGFGNIGKKVAKIGEAIGMQVLVSSRRKYADCPYEQVDTEELFRKSDYLTLHCPLNEESKNLVNAGTLDLMKSSAVIINTSRGGVVDSQALAEALNCGKIRGAGIDVLVKEPMAEDDPLYTAKNCMITPHIGWASIESRTRLMQQVADNLSAWMTGKPVHVVN
ncbi:MAG: D-2-hydroxyacid dehydrogenase [Lachnospiraceae bacterium]|nr:D-2-hydroxyacid dehydrogenase [Lachnospiraceae bacterium]